MNKVITTVAAGIIATTSVTANAEEYGMDPYIYHALVDTCKAALTDNTLRLKKTMKSYRLDAETVASKVNCNGVDIIEFAAINNADATAGYLSNKLGRVQISDLAMNSQQKLRVDFDF